MMTVSALCKFRPKPPARVDSKNMKYSELASLNFFSSSPRSSAFVIPSNLIDYDTMQLKSEIKKKILDFLRWPWP